MEKVKLDNKRILFNLLPAHVAQHFLMSNPRNMVSVCRGEEKKVNALSPRWESRFNNGGTPELQVWNSLTVTSSNFRIFVTDQSKKT